MQLFNEKPLPAGNASKLLNINPTWWWWFIYINWKLFIQRVCFQCICCWSGEKNRTNTNTHTHTHAQEQKKCKLLYIQSISQLCFHSICKEHMVNSHIKYFTLLNKSSILINLMRFFLSRLWRIQYISPSSSYCKIKSGWKSILSTENFLRKKNLFLS